MAIRTRRWRSPEECVAGLRLDAAGLVVMGLGLSVSGVIIALLVRTISG